MDLNRLRAQFGSATIIPSLQAPCAGEGCQEVVLYHDPPLRLHAWIEDDAQPTQRYCEFCDVRQTFDKATDAWPPEGTCDKVYCPACWGKLTADDPSKAVTDYMRVGVPGFTRLALLFADRFAKRHGRKPRVGAVERYKRMLMAWDPKKGDLQVLANRVEQARKDHVLAWCRRYPVQPRDDFEELKRIASDVMRVMTEDELNKNIGGE